MSKPMTRAKPALLPVRAIATTPPAGPERIASLPGEQIGRGEAARRHHEHQPRAGALDVELAADARDVARQDRREIGVDHRRVAAPDQLDQRRAFVADGDLRKAERARDFRDFALVLGIAVGVHEDDRDGVEALGLRARQDPRARRRDRAPLRSFRPPARARRPRSRRNRAARA